MIVLDGGMGTLLQARGLRPGVAPEDWNVDRPEEIQTIHRSYVAAGAQVIYANTFGANRLKYRGRHTLERVISAAVENAKAAVRDAGRSVRVALDIGPTGRLLRPSGDLSFDEACAGFAEVVRIGVAAGADLVVIETMGDLRELKAAVIAARESCCSLPVYATVTLGADGKLLTGSSVECVAAVLESLGVDAYGFNCGLGPDQMLPYVERLARLATKPIIVKPNAGLPKVVDGRTVFTIAPAEFAADVRRLVAAGASIVGGCCGTTPAHIQQVVQSIADMSVAAVEKENAVADAEQVSRARTIVSSGIEVVELHPHEGLVIGERINPTGKKLLKEAYRNGDTAYVLREAVSQVDAGARVLDVNCGVPGLDEAALLDATVDAVQGVVTCPLQIDTADPAALARALRHVNGKPLVNSVNGKRESMDAVFPLVRKFGGVIVALCLDEGGIPTTSDGRLDIARRILAEGAKYGFAKEDFVFDALTLSVSSDPQAALVTLETVRRLTDELGVNTVLGVSNVSFGLPNRPALNNAMYALAKRAGLSAAIANPLVLRDELAPAAEAVLLGRDPNCANWIRLNAAEPSPSAPPATAPRVSPAVPDLALAIRRGLRDDADAAARAALVAGRSPLDVISDLIVPALEEVGRGFEKGTLYLPQLLMAADAAGAAFAVVKERIKAEGSESSGSQPLKPSGNRTVVLATVKGDIHDIGKNIVRALLENYGFDVIDLGRDVPPEAVVETAQRSGAMLVGLSALMTTTVGAMAETIRQIRAAGLSCKTCVGGAVVTQEYAEEIGADFYAKDAMRTVRIAEELSSLR